MIIPDSQFDAAAQSVAQPDTDPMDRAASQVAGDQKVRLRASLYSSLMANPDMAARAQRLGRKTGLPGDVVERNLPEVERSAALNDIDLVLERSPALAQWLANPKNARVAHDDVPQMGAVEAAVKWLVSAPGAPSTLGGTLRSAYYGASAGSAGVFQAVAGTAAPLLDFLEPVQGIGGNPLRRLQEGFGLIAQDALASQKAARGKSATWLGSAVDSGVESLAQNAGFLPLALLPGGQAAALTGMSAMAGGQTYTRDIQKGQGHWPALMHGASDAVIEAGTEMLPMARLIGDIKAGAPLFQTLLKNAALEVPGEQAATALQDLNDWAVNNNGRTFGDYLKERPEAAAQTLIATLVGVGGNVAIMKGVQGVADRAAGTERRAQLAEQHGQALADVSKLIEASKLRQRDPEAFATFAQSLTEEGVSSLYVDARALQQSGVDLQALAQAMPSVAQQIEQAAATGGDVVIPTAEFLTQAPGQEWSAALIDHARTGADAMSPAGAREYMQAHGEQLQEEIAKTIEQHATDQEWQAGRDAVRSSFEAQLNEVGRFTPDVNRQYAALLGDFYAATAERAGMTPKELVQRYPLRIQATAPGGAVNAMEQGGDTYPVTLPIDKLTQEQMLARGADGHLTSARERYIPIDKIDGLEPTPGAADERGYEKGRPITQPVEAVYDRSTDTYMLYAGNHRVTQAKLNEHTHIRAFVQPDGGIVGPSATTLRSKTNLGHGTLNQSARLPATIDIDGQQRPTTNSKGQQIAATEEGVRAFYRWFKDSKVVDADGRPLVVYHGTKGDFVSFSADKLGSASKATSAKGGFFFAAEPERASFFSELGKDRDYAEREKENNDDTKSFFKLQKRLVVVASKHSDGVNWPGNRYISVLSAKDGTYHPDVVSVAEQLRALDERINEFRNWPTPHNFTQAGYTAFGGRNTMPVYLSATNPKVVDFSGKERSHADLTRELNKTKKGEYDALIAKNIVDPTVGDNYIVFDPTQIKSATANTGTFDPANPSILNQNARGQIAFGQDLTQAPSVISLFDGADFSTLIHEAGHFFLEAHMDLAGRIAGRIADGEQVSDGERGIVADANALLGWFGLQDTPELSALDQWHTMTLDEKRSHHEKFARGFEVYAIEGKAPSLSLQSVFQRFSGWLKNVYRSITQRAAEDVLQVSLTDEVRQVMDRMIATDEQIAEAQAMREMGPLFGGADQAGMSSEQWAQYHELAAQATANASEQLQARGLRDMQWLRNARSRELKRLQARAAGLRREVEMEVRRDVLSMPIYRAWQFLTTKGDAQATAQPTPRVRASGALDPASDNLFTAIAKLGGLDRSEVVGAWGVDPKDRLESGVFGVPVLRKENGLSIDAMAEKLAEEGYLLRDENGRTDPADLEAAFDSQRRGVDQYSTWHDMAEDARVRAATQQDAPEALPDEIMHGKLDTAVLRDMYGTKPDALWRTLSDRRMTSEAQGIHPEVVAETFGYDSADALVRALAAADPPRQVIEGLTDQRMLERYGDLATPDGLQRAADEAIHNEARARAIATELDALERMGKVRAGGPRTADVLAKAARDYAAAVIGAKKVRDIRPGEYTAAEARASKAAQKAFKAGDTLAAATEKRHQLIQHAAAKAALQAREEIDKTLDYLRRMAKRPKSIAPDYADQIDQLLERFDLRPASLKELDKRAGLQAWVTAQQEQGKEVDIPPELLNEAARTSWRNLTLDELRGLRDTVKQIEHMGRTKGKLLASKAKREFEAVRDELADGIELHSRGRTADTRTPATVLGRRLAAIKRFGAAHIKVATWARIFDGGRDGGPAWEYLIRGANDAGDFETTRRAQATEALTKILSPVITGLQRKAQYPSIGRSLTREQVLVMALNTGNEGNWQRMLDGEGWTRPQVMGVLNTLTAAEWQAVQGVWDHMESYRPEIGAKEKRVYGKEPEWVQSVPLLVDTSDGQRLTLRGGYFPIKYDPAANARAEGHADAEDAKRQMQGAYTSATTRRGFTKSRVQEVKGRPLMYSLSAVYGGVQDVIHDLAWHEWLIDTNKLLRSEKVDAAIRQHYGPEVVKQVKDWVKDIAAGDGPAQGAVDEAVSRLRRGVSVAGLGFNVMSAVMQPLGLTQSMVRVGAAWIGRGVAQYIASPRAAARRVNAASEFMASRARTRFRELNELRNQVEGQAGALRWVQQHSFWLMMRAQQTVDIPTWLGAYEKAISEGSDEARSVALADQAVIDSQGGGQLKDLAGIERGGPAQKLFTVFYSFFNTALNIGIGQGMTADTPAKRAKLAADALLLYSVPAVLGAILKDALQPGGDDDPEELAKKLAAAQLDYLMGLFVLVRETTEAVKIVTGLEDRPRDYAGPAGLRVILDAFKFAKQAGQGEFDDAFRKASVNLIGSAFGLPAAQVNRTITGAQALAEDETDNPAALVFGFQKER